MYNFLFIIMTLYNISYSIIQVKEGVEKPSFHGHVRKGGVGSTLVRRLKSKKVGVSCFLF